MHYAGVIPMHQLYGYSRLARIAGTSALALMLPLLAMAQTASVAQLSAPPAGEYDRTLTMQFTARFSAPVAVQGAPRLMLQVGAVTRYATLTASLSVGAPSTLLTFEYLPAADDVDRDGIMVANSIDLNGGTITTSDLAPATLTFTPPDTRGVTITVLRPPTPRIAAALRSGTPSRVMLEGTADGNSMVLVSRADLGLIGVTMAAANGAWSFEAPARAGSFQFTAQAENADGIVSAASTPMRVTIVETAAVDGSGIGV